MTAVAIFWVACGVLAYTLVGYPVVMGVWARRRPRRPSCSDDTPSVTIVLVVHDEAERITARLENLLALDYPADRVSILVCSDGSSDATVCLARACTDPRVSVLAFERWRGKPAVLDDALAGVTAEIVIFADVRQRFDPAAARALVAPFGDPQVGAVSGELHLATSPNAPAVASGVGAYWRYEKAIRHAESLVDSSVGATGAIYAIRRSLFTPIPAATILDDVLIPMTIVRAGYRTVFEPRARAYDDAASTAREEFARKARTIAGTFELFARERWLLNPRRNRLWLQTVSHKLLRLLGPLALAAALAASAVLVGRPFYRMALAVQLLLYGVALSEHLRRARAVKPGRAAKMLFGVPYAFCVLQAATLSGFVRFVTGRQAATWAKAEARSS